jgi:hypothetical protein
MKKDLQFKTSTNLKSLFNENFEKWDQNNNGGYEELGRRCGLTGSYISQIGRFGRIPSRSALILLAFNFELRDPSSIFKAADLIDSWPYKKYVHLSSQPKEGDSFVSLKVDMEGLLNVVQTAIGNEIRPKTVKENLKGRPLRVGYNPFKSWLFKSLDRDVDGTFKGFFPEVCKMFEMSLQTKIEDSVIDYGDYSKLFQSGSLDLYGPIVVAPNLPTGVIFTNPLYRIGMSLVYRLRANKSLDELPQPKTPKDLLNPKYKIAVVKNSRAHLLCNTRYKRADKDLIICATVEEALDRTVLKGIFNPAHCFMVTSVDAKFFEQEYKRDVKALFVEKGNLLDLSEAGIAVRSDWPELVQALNESIAFLTTTGTLLHTLEDWRPKGMEDVLEGI